MLKLFSSSMTIDECTSLHEKWRQYQRQWFFAHQSDFEQKLVMADEVFRKTRSSVNNLFQNNSSDGAQSQRKLRLVLFLPANFFHIIYYGVTGVNAIPKP